MNKPDNDKSRTPWSPPELTTLSISRNTEQSPGIPDPPDPGQQS